MTLRVRSGFNAADSTLRLRPTDCPRIPTRIDAAQRELSGAPFRVSVHAPAPTFRLLTGSPKIYVKTGDSGGRRRNSFCGNCGSPIAACADADDPPTYSLRVGCLAQKHALPPKRRIWCKSALPWALNVGAVPGIEHQ